jgi:hypothetical protein
MKWAGGWVDASVQSVRGESKLGPEIFLLASCRHMVTKISMWPQIRVKMKNIEVRFLHGIHCGS